MIKFCTDIMDDKCLHSVLGNCLVIMATLQSKEMRTARNVFIFSLALSDLLLAVTIPLTVLDGMTRSWILPNSDNLCR